MTNVTLCVVGLDKTNSRRRNGQTRCCVEVPDIVVTGPTPPQSAHAYDNVSFQVDSSPGHKTSKLHQRVSSSISRSVSSACSHMTHAKRSMVKRSQSNQTRKEWMKMMRDTFLPTIRVRSRQNGGLYQPRIPEGQESEKQGSSTTSTVSEIGEDWTYEDADIDAVLGELDEQSLSDVENENKEDEHKEYNQKDIEEYLNTVGRGKVNLGANFDGSIRSFNISDKSDFETDEISVSDNGYVVTSSDVTAGEVDSKEEQVQEAEVKLRSNNPFATDWALGIINKSFSIEHEEILQNISRSQLSTSSSSEESEVVTITVRGRRSGSRARRKHGTRNPFLKKPVKRNTSYIHTPDSAYESELYATTVLPSSKHTNPFLIPNGQTSIASSDNNATTNNPFLLHSEDESALTISLNGTNPFLEFIEQSKGSDHVTNPFHSSDHTKGFVSRSERSNNIHMPISRSLPRSRRDMGNRRGKVRRAWRSAAMAISIVDLLRSKSERLAVLDNGQTVDASKSFNPFLVRLPGHQEDSNSEDKGMKAFYKTDFL